MLQLGASAAAPRAPPVGLQAGAYTHSEGFHPLLQPCLSGAAAALPAAALPRAPLSGAGSEHSPRRGGNDPAPAPAPSSAPSLLPVRRTGVFQELSGDTG